MKILKYKLRVVWLIIFMLYIENFPSLILLNVRVFLIGSTAQGAENSHNLTSFLFQHPSSPKPFSIIFFLPLRDFFLLLQACACQKTF